MAQEEIILKVGCSTNKVGELLIALHNIDCAKLVGIEVTKEIQLTPVSHSGEITYTPTRKKWKRLPKLLVPQTKAKAVSLLKQGKGPTEISKELGVSKSFVARLV